MNKISRVFFPFSFVLTLSACEKVQSFTATTVKCGDDIVTSLVVETMNKSISDLARRELKEYIEDENLAFDQSKLRAQLQQIRFNIDDIRTNNSDPNSRKEFCVAHIDVIFPEELIEEANASRALNNENQVAQTALASDIEYELNTAKHALEYMVQPTDDGKKVYVELENSQAIAYFTSQVLISALLKTPRENAYQLHQQVEQERIATEQAALKEYESVLLNEAQKKLDTANKALNTVWNTPPKEFRDEWLDEQRIWLKKRELECKLKTVNEEQSEVARLNCEADMTVQRTRVLQQMVMNAYQVNDIGE